MDGEMGECLGGFFFPLMRLQQHCADIIAHAAVECVWTCRLDNIKQQTIEPRQITDNRQIEQTAWMTTRRE